MEIDPRLRASSDHGAGEGGGGGGPAVQHSYDPSPSSAHAVSPAGSAPTPSYPEIPSHYSPGEQFHSSTPSSGNHTYYGPPPQTPHSYYPGDTPAIAAAPRVESTDANDPFADLKRPRACEACRQLKVRCEPDNDNPTGTCKRCAKAGRTCIVTAPTRKRQKKTDSRVAELEKKIDVLTASLQARARGADLGILGPHSDDYAARRWLGSGQPQRYYSDGQPNGAAAPGSPATLAGNKRHHTGEFKSASHGGLLTPVNARDAGGPSAGTWPSVCSSGDTVLKSDGGHEFADVIDRGIVDVDTAIQAFDRYVNDMAPLMPVVVFLPETKMGDIRRTKPVLFLAILSVSVGSLNPAIQLHLVNEVYRVLADRIFIKGEKSLELVQALLVSCLWYIPPDHFEELKFYQLIHMAVVIGMDIGMNRRTKTKTKPFGFWREIMGKKASSLNPDAPETRRAWVGCYFMAVQSATALRRSFLVRWQPYMDECLEILENSPDALPSDKVLVHWAKLAHLSEEVSFQFSMDDPTTSLSLSDPKVQYALKGFEKQLEQWRKEVPPDLYSPMMRHFEHVLNVYMHEIAMHVDHNIDDFRPPFVSESRENQADLNTAAHVDALTSCLTSAHEALNIISSLDHKTIICLPTVHFGRTSYASVALIKLFSAVSAPDSRLGQVFNPADIKVEYYLDKVIEHFKVAGDSSGGRTAAKFSLVLTMLKHWFLKRKDHEDQEGLCHIYKAYEKAGNPKDPNEQTKSTEGEEKTKTANMGPTPLHLLSEVAMGEPNNRPNSHQESQGQSHYPPPPTNGPGGAVGTSPVQDPGPSTASTSTAMHNVGSDTWTRYPPPPPVHSTTTPSSQSVYPPHSGRFRQPPGYDDPNNPMATTVAQNPQAAYAGFVPELAMQVGFDPDNFYALGNILDEGFFNFSMGLDPNSF